MIRNALQGLINEWNATDQPLQQRGGVLPLGIYEDGSVHLAWPGMITDTIDAFERAGQGPGMQNPEDAFIIGGSLGVGGLAAPRPRNALASNSVRQEAPNNAVRRARPDMGQNAWEIGNDDAFIIGRRDTDNNALRITGSRLSPEMRGKGLGLRLYRDLIDGAHAEGMPVISDSIVSNDASHIYEALQRRGYKVEKNPDATLAAHGDGQEARSGIYRVDPPGADFPGLFSNPKESALAPAAVNALADDSSRGITAYHGSPHDFDKFSLDKLGTGEGAQAYGHGLYFSEEEAVAKNYRDRLSRKAFNLDGNRLPMDHYLFDAGYRFGDAESTDDALRRMAAERRREAEYKSKLPETSLGRRSVPALLKEADELESMVGRLTENKGRMYKVRINADPDQFLDLDAPVSAIPETHRQALEQIGSYPKTLEHTKALREAGIPGIRYLDGQSRGAGQGSRNYVVFDENLIDIIEKYANPWTSAPLGLAPSAFDDNPRNRLARSLLETY